ncbi:MAG: hypothetical protein HQK86_06965 [Nitrospinae bacterium]|nr:hypothetical protein [Nitrospinota bacterium]
MSVFTAYFSSIASFFSIWIFCLFQIIPFFMAFIVGAALTGGKDGDPRRIAGAALLSLISFIGFTFIFTSMGLVPTAISKVIFNSLSLGNQIGGVVIGVIGLYLLGVLSFEKDGSSAMTAARYALALLFGIAVALAYRPCVTPALTEIYKIASNPASVGEGGVLLTAYSLGIATVISAAGLAVSWGIEKASSHRLETVVKNFCGAVLLVIAGLVLTGNMTTYKSFLVGRFVPDAPSAESEIKRD